MINYLRVVWIIVQYMEVSDFGNQSAKGELTEEEALFMEAIKGEQIPTYADRIVEEVKAEFEGRATIIKEREDEKRTLSERLVQLKARLNKTKNVKNPSKIALNAEIAKKRAAMRKEIEEIKDKLYNIELEEKGSSMTSENIVNAAHQ